MLHGGDSSDVLGVIEAQQDEAAPFAFPVLSLVPATVGGLKMLSWQRRV